MRRPPSRTQVFRLSSDLFGIHVGVAAVGQDEHVVLVQAHAAQVVGAEHRERVAELLLEEVPHLAKGGGIDAGAGYYGHRRRLHKVHRAGAQVAARGGEARFHGHDRGAGRVGLGAHQLVEPRPEALVAGAGDDERAGRVLLAFRLERFFGVAHLHFLLQQAAEEAHVLQAVPAGQVGVGAGVGGGAALHAGGGGGAGRGIEAAGHGVGFQAEGVGQGPGSDVVGERVFELRAGLEQHLHQRRFGLVHADNHVLRLDGDVAVLAGAVVEAARFGAPGGVAVANLVAVEVLGEGVELAGVVAGRHHVALVLALGLAGGLAEVALELAQQVVVPLGGGLDGGAAGGVVVGDALGQRQGVAVEAGVGHAGGAAAALLVGHADGAVEAGPGVAVGRGVKVVDFAGEIQPVILVETPPCCSRPIPPETGAARL